MISRYAWYLREFLKKVWVRVVSFALLALLAAALARLLSPYLPPALSLQTGSEAVSQLLGILTSSMLAVTTFSLSIAVSAFAAAAGAAAEHRRREAETRHHARIDVRGDGADHDRPLRAWRTLGGERQVAGGSRRSRPAGQPRGAPRRPAQADAPKP